MAPPLQMSRRGGSSVSLSVIDKRMLLKIFPYVYLSFLVAETNIPLFICFSSAEGSCRVSVAVPQSVRQVVLFSSGPWGERICVNAELNDADRFPITIGKLTPYNK